MKKDPLSSEAISAPGAKLMDRVLAGSRSYRRLEGPERLRVIEGAANAFGYSPGTGWWWHRKPDPNSWYLTWDDDDYDRFFLDPECFFDEGEIFFFFLTCRDAPMSWAVAEITLSEFRMFDSATEGDYESYVFARDFSWGVLNSNDGLIVFVGERWSSPGNGIVLRQP